MQTSKKPGQTFLNLSPIFYKATLDAPRIKNAHMPSVKAALVAKQMHVGKK